MNRRAMHRALIIFLLTCTALATGRLDRAGAALTGASLAIAVSGTLPGAAEETPSSFRSSESVPAVTIERSAHDNATVYLVSRGDCTIKWIIRDTESDRGVVKHRAQCAEPLARQLPLLTEICKAFFKGDRNASALRTLFWGGLEAEREPASGEMSLRLALAAYRSPEWDAVAGRPKRGDLNGFVRDLANRETIYPELTELFKVFRRSIRVAAVEKVRVLRAGKLPFYEKLKQHGVSPSARLPFDGMTWFAVSPDSEP